MSEKYFGQEMGTYTKMYHFGLWMALVGLLLAILSYFMMGSNMIIITMGTFGMVFLFLGGMLVVAGYTGYNEEKKRLGIKKVKTLIGVVSFSIFGVYFLLSYLLALFGIVITYNYVGISLLLIQTILGGIAKKNGDNTYGEAGLYTGAILLITIGIVVLMFYLSGHL